MWFKTIDTNSGKLYIVFYIAFCYINKKLYDETKNNSNFLKKEQKMKNVVFCILLSGLVFVSCVSLEYKTIPNEAVEIIAEIETTFSSWQLSYLYKKIDMQGKAYSRLLSEAQSKYGEDVDVINIKIKGSFSGHNLWYFPLKYSLLIPYVEGLFGLGYALRAPLLESLGSVSIFIGPFLGGSYQKITVTGDVINSNIQGDNNLHRANITAIEPENQNDTTEETQSGRQSREADPLPVLGEPTVLQQALNRLPAVPIAGNNLKFEFGGNIWIATLNGRNFLAGTISTQETDEGSILTLRQTHIYPPRNIPGIRWVRTPGPDIVLEYRIGPPASLRPYRN